MLKRFVCFAFYSIIRLCCLGVLVVLMNVPRVRNKNIIINEAIKENDENQ